MDSNMVGSILKDRYEIIAELGQGGMSTVYLARDLKLESYWAVKRVSNDSTVDIDAFKMEVELLSSLNHSDIPRIVDRIETDDYYFVIMDFIDGISLKKKVMSEGVQNEKDIVEWAKLLCDILIYLHTARKNPIIYRDMKPDNVMLTQSGRVKLIDFGIAKECERGTKQDGIGTPGYAAPEQYVGASNILDERSDIYSLGATMYFLATGERPARPPEGVGSVAEVNQYISEGLEYIIYKCTRDNPEQRYENCHQLKEDLNNIDKMTSSYRRRMRNKLMAFAASVFIFILSGVTAVLCHAGIENEKRDNYLYYYNLAETANREGDYDTAAQHYLEAISYDATNTDTYIQYFNTIIPENDDKRYDSKLESAINIMKNSYIDNTKSEMYRNKKLMYMVAKKCLELTDAGYISYAAEYMNYLAEENYGEGDLLSYKIISENLSKNLEEIDFKSVYQALNELETITDEKTMETNEKLENYYNLMKAYSQYPTYISEQAEDDTYAYDRIAALGNKARDVIADIGGQEEIAFKGIIKLHELVASGLCSKAIYLNDNKDKYNTYKEAVVWFGYLKDYGTELDSSLHLKKANAYMGLYEFAEEEREVKNIEAAIEEYKKAADSTEDDFVARVYLTEALLVKENAKPREAREYREVYENYRFVDEMYQSMKDKLSNVEITRYSALKQEMKNAGLEVRA